MGSAAALQRIIEELEPFAVAVSGGVDSMTLSLIAHRCRRDVHVYHAISPAVPARATERVRRFARDNDWSLHEISAGEFEDGNYVANPYNRCYFCKMNLYAEIRRHTDRLILSGANTDDLSDYRPGLDAASENAVRHPYVEAGVSKAEVRALAHSLGAHALADLPASPCLSSRIETGIAVDPGTLRTVDEVELWLVRSFGARQARCRVRRGEITIELDDALVPRLSVADTQAIETKVRRSFSAGYRVRISGYSMGSAFIPPARSA